MNYFLRKEWFAYYNEGDMRSRRRLHGGRIRGQKYFIAILDGDWIAEVYFSQLLNNFQSQKNSMMYPEGYLSFAVRGIWNPWNFDISTKRFELKRLKISGNTLHLVSKRYAAGILKAPQVGSELHQLLQYQQMRTRQEDGIRWQLGGQSVETLGVVGSLLRESALAKVSGEPAGMSQVDGFEVYLRLCSNLTLGDMYRLLKLDTFQPLLQIA